MPFNSKRPELQEIDTLRELLDAWDKLEDAKAKDLGPVYRIRVRKLNPRTSTFHIMASVPVEGCDEQYIQVRFGGGKYRLECLSRSMRICTSLTTELAEPDEALLEEFSSVVRTPDPAYTPPAPAPPPPGTVNPDVQLLRDEVERQSRLLERLVDRADERPQSSLNDTVNALVTLQKMNPPAPVGPSMDDLLLRAIEVVDKMRSAASPASSESNEWIGFVRDIWKQAGPELTALGRSAIEKQQAEARVNVPADVPPIPEQATGEGEDEDVTPTEDDLRNVFGFVDLMIQRGTEASVIAEMILVQIEQDPVLAAIGADVVSQPFDKVTLLDPDRRFIEDPKRSQFRDVWKLINAKLQPGNDQLRTVGNG